MTDDEVAHPERGDLREVRAHDPPIGQGAEIVASGDTGRYDGVEAGDAEGVGDRPQDVRTGGQEAAERDVRPWPTVELREGVELRVAGLVSDARPEQGTAIWAAGVTASELARLLEVDVKLDGAGRIPVGPDLTLPSHTEVFAIGDLARVQHADVETPPPGLAPVAIQEGRYVAHTIQRRLAAQPVRPFHYREKGNLATIGRSRAVCDLKVIGASGFFAWTLWLIVRLFYLIGFENRLLVVVRWTFSFLTHGRGARLINPRNASPTIVEAGAAGIDKKKRAPWPHEETSCREALDLPREADPNSVRLPGRSSDRVAT
jgi:hypothetical protein